MCVYIYIYDTVHSLRKGSNIFTSVLPPSRTLALAHTMLTLSRQQYLFDNELRMRDLSTEFAFSSVFKNPGKEAHERSVPFTKENPLQMSFISLASKLLFQKLSFLTGTPIQKDEYPKRNQRSLSTARIWLGTVTWPCPSIFKTMRVSHRMSQDRTNASDVR